MRRRPLRPLELCVIRLIAVNAVGGDTKPEVLNRWASVGALEAGAAPGELERIMIDDLERDASGQVVAFHAPGTSRDVTSGFPVTVPRTLTVPRWARPGFTTIADDDSDVQAGRPVLQGRITRSERAGAVASKMSMRFRHVIEYAGLHHDATVEPLSIRNGAARLVRDAHGIEAAARQLGHTSIDFVMGEIGLAVRRPVRPRRP